jgi:hypothetical protein
VKFLVLINNKYIAVKFDMHESYKNSQRKPTLGFQSTAQNETFSCLKSTMTAVTNKVAIAYPALLESVQSMRRGRPIKYPRPPECPHLGRPEHANGVCYQCSSNINNQKKREKRIDERFPLHNV